ncbi:MAG TPA: rhomboid family intramembrane serine protease [Rhodanobacteraceae bacterium]|nr:rhomboid family intramembrane serine protease [Rhodanobacteraceae bacterium]
MIITLILIAVTCIVSLMAFGKPRLLDALILWPPAISRKHEYWRLLTYGLVHADGSHLLFNMLTLFFFGRAMEALYAQYLGPFGFALFYAGGLLVSILPSWWAHRKDANYRSLGASGAVSAVLFAFILLQPWAMIIVFFLPLPAILYAIAYVAYSIYMDRPGLASPLTAAGRINHSAHMWGGAYGVLFTVFMEPRVVLYFVEQLKHPHF